MNSPNSSSNVRTTLTRELWTADDRSAQFKTCVSLFGGNIVRIGISRFWWCEDEKRFVPSRKGHCYFPLEVLDGLTKVIPELEAEAKRLSLLTKPSRTQNGDGMCTCTTSLNRI